MNGAEALLQTLSDCGIDVCFANLGTSEMQLVAAIDQQPQMRAILGLFDGVVTGAADGYGRMVGEPPQRQARPDAARQYCRRSCERSREV